MSLGYTPHFIYKVYIFISPNCLPYETRWGLSCTSVSPPPACWLCRPLVLAALQCPLSPPPLAGIPSSPGHQFPIMLCSKVGIVEGSGPRRTWYVSPRSTSRSRGTEMACEQCWWLLASAHSASAPGWVPADRWSCLDTEACIVVPTHLCPSLSEHGLCPKLPILHSFGTDSLELLWYSSIPEAEGKPGDLSEQVQMNLRGLLWPFFWWRTCVHVALVNSVNFWDSCFRTSVEVIPF